MCCSLGAEQAGCEPAGLAERAVEATSPALGGGSTLESCFSGCGSSAKAINSRFASPEIEEKKETHSYVCCNPVSCNVLWCAQIFLKCHMMLTRVSKHI